MHRLAARFGLAGALLLPSLLAAAPRLAARGADGRTLVVADEGRWSVAAGASRTELPVPAGARIERVTPTAGGWIAAGTVDSPFGRDLLFFEKKSAGVGLLKPPGRPIAPFRAEPLVLASGGRALGAAWLEGDRRERYAVRFAAWDGASFGAPLQVAPAGPGSQLALAGTVLADGRILLVWAGFDGEDDEIWAAIGRDQSWSAPVRVGGDNRVPDILPDVVADGAGALVVWSRLDGDEYRLAMAAFDGKGFGAARFVAAPGSLAATFEQVDGVRALLYRDARAGAWALAELSPAGAAGRAARVAGSRDERPAVAADRAGVTWTFGARTVASPWR